MSNILVVEADAIARNLMIRVLYAQGFTVYEAATAAALREARLKLQPHDSVRVARFDKIGRVIRVDHKRNIVVVSVGLGVELGHLHLDYAYQSFAAPSGGRHRFGARWTP